MFRITLIQNYINKYGYTRYLEIGTFKGESFFPIVCKKKIAVDPKFLFTNKDKLKWIFKNTCNIKNTYFQLESEIFYSLEKRYLKSNKIDIVFIDGLHTFISSLNDTLNSLEIINDNGVIILHDCLPPHEAAETPAKSYEDAYNNRLSNWTGEWCGDVWKTIVYLRSKYPETLNIHTINKDYGLGVVSLIRPINDFSIDEDLFNEINKLSYEDLRKDYKTLLNIREYNLTK